MMTPEGTARDITVIGGEPPILQLPWDEASMVHDTFRRWGAAREIGDAFGHAYREFLDSCRADGITPPQARFGLQLDMSAIPATAIADSLRAYDALHTDFVLNAQPPYDVNSLDFMSAAMKHKKVEHATARLHQLGLIPGPELPGHGSVVTAEVAGSTSV